MEHLTLQEISRRSINLTKYEDFYLNSNKLCFALRTDKFVHFFHYSLDVQCREKKLDTKETSLKTPINSPASNLCFNKYITKYEISGMDLSCLITDPALWSHNKALLREMANFIDIKWAPTDFPQILATLNNVGNVELFIKERKVWRSILNISSHVKKEFEDETKKIDSLADLKDAVYPLESCAMCWCPKINEDGSIYFATAQKNGVILIWLIKQEVDDVISEYCGKIERNTDEIINVLWIPREANFLLICSTVLGQLHVFQCQMKTRKVALLNTNILWGCKDRMLATQLNYSIVGNKVVLICNKHRHLLIQMLNDDIQVLSQHLDNLNDHKITAIVKRNNGYYVGTCNSKLFYMTFQINSNDLEVQKQMIEIKDISSTMELGSIATSYNQVIITLALIDRKILNRKGPIQVDVVFFYEEPSVSEFSILLDNPSKKLTNYWDCIELLRYKIMKTKTLPQYDYNKLLVDGDNDVYKLKLYLIIYSFYKVLEDNLKICGKLLPQNSVESIKEKILVINANTLVKNLYNKYLIEGLAEFEEESFVGCRKYIEYYCKKYCNSINNFETSSILDLVNKDYKYICQSCEENIECFTCTKGHLNLYCGLSFTPIESNDYLACEYCHLTARIELLSQKPLCSFCDIYLERS